MICLGCVLIFSLVSCVCSCWCSGKKFCGVFSDRNWLLFSCFSECSVLVISLLFSYLLGKKFIFGVLCGLVEWNMFCSSQVMLILCVVVGGGVIGFLGSSV